MESTTLEAAAESLLATAPEQSGEDNLSEAVEAITAPDEDQVEEVEAATESEDDVEASSEDLDDLDDVEIDDEDLVEATEDTNFIPVKVDGKVENWTLDQLKQSAAGQAAINKRFQEVAEMRKHTEQTQAALQQQQQQFMQLYQQAQQNGVQAPVPPSRELFENDPIGFMEQKLKYDEDKVQYDSQMQQVQHMQNQQHQQQAQAHQAYLQQQAESLVQHIPELGNPESSDKVKSALVETGIEYGFTAEEMQMVTDSRYVRALNDARKYKQLVAKRKQAQKKGENVRPVVKAGAAKRKDGDAVTRNKAQARLQKTGSIDDALSLILNQ
tara:strand:+ start:2536 stop:3516 length:981 start_codon:yes stop_codon:yes gene_type:complete